MLPEALKPSASARWTGRILSGLVVAFLIFDASMKLVPLQPVMEAMTGLGFEESPRLARSLGALLLICTLLHTLPRTRLIGAILLTGFLGGGMAIQMRAGNPLFTHVLFGAYLCLIMWLGMFASQPHLRALLFPRSSALFQSKREENPPRLNGVR